MSESFSGADLTLEQPPLIPVAGFTVTDAADLDAAIDTINVTSPGSTLDTDYTITLNAPSGTLALDAAMASINLASGDTLTVIGNGETLDGGNNVRGLYVYAGSVLLQDLTIANALAQGGDGQDGVDGGGGGAGVGGGLFIAQGGSVTLEATDFINDAAIGGAGGNRVNPNGYSAGTDVGANGGFGTGGGGGGTGGAGGFGGGGGGGNPGGGTGFGGGYGGSGVLGAGGGGGLGAGGDIFVHSGGVLTIRSGTLAAGTVIGGAGSSGGGNGQALGGGIFLTGNQSFSLDPATGQTIEIDGVIADTSVVGELAPVTTQFYGGAFGSVFTLSVNMGSNVSIIGGFVAPPFVAPPFVDPYQAPAPLLQAPGGTVVLTAANAYTSGTVINGTLELGNAQAAGTGPITFAVSGVLRVDGTSMPGNAISGFGIGETIDLANVVATGPVVLSEIYAYAYYAYQVAVPVADGGTLTLRLDNSSGSSLTYGGDIAWATPDGDGGTDITILPGVSVTRAVWGTPGGTFNIPFATGAYSATAQSLLSQANSGVGNGQTVPADGTGGAAIPALTGGTPGEIVLHGAGAVTVPTGYGTVVSDSAAPVSITGGTASGALVVSGTGDLTYVAGAGAGTVIAGGGNDFYTVAPGSGDQVLLLGNGADTVMASGGDDTIDGNAGGKLVYLGTGTSLFISHAVAGGAADTVVGASGAASVNATAGTIDVSVAGAMTISAGGATSHITGSGAATRINFTGSAPATVQAVAGSMTVAASGGGMFVAGIAGGNQISASGPATLVGSAAGDVLRASGTATAVLLGGAGAETLDGSGSSGNDMFFGGTGAETILTGSGRNAVMLGAGTANVLAQGNDSITGGSGAATITAAGPSAAITTGQGGSVVRLGAGTDVVRSGGPDLIMGGSGAATVFAGQGGALISRGSGTLDVIAGAGPATVVAGMGTITLDIAAGSAGGALMIIDWNPAEDSIALHGYAPGAAADALANAIEANGNLYLSLSDGTHLTFLGLPSLDTSAFHG